MRAAVRPNAVYVPPIKYLLLVLNPEIFERPSRRGSENGVGVVRAKAEEYECDSENENLIGSCVRASAYELR